MKFGTFLVPLTSPAKSIGYFRFWTHTARVLDSVLRQNRLDSIHAHSVRARLSETLPNAPSNGPVAVHSQNDRCLRGDPIKFGGDTQSTDGIATPSAFRASSNSTPIDPHRYKKLSMLLCCRAERPVAVFLNLLERIFEHNVFNLHTDLCSMHRNFLPESLR
jgi:hypothetical protein